MGKGRRTSNLKDGAAPSWTHCCASPTCAYPAKPPSQPQYPAFPGVQLDTISDWQSKCLASGTLGKDQVNQYGNCSFLLYAQQVAPGGMKNGTCKVPGFAEITGVEVEASKVANGVVCFPNRKEQNDDLCIFQDFSMGNVNVEQMTSWASPDVNDLTQKLQKLFDGAAMTTDQKSLAGKTVCLHHGDEASVGWTHVHIFDLKDFPHGFPDGLQDGTNAYCEPYSAAAANALASKVVNRINTSLKMCAR